MPGSSAAAVRPQARIHTYTTTNNTIPIPVRRHRRRRLRRAILPFAGRQLARCTTVPHVRRRRRSWIVSIASLCSGGRRNLLSDSSSLSPLSVPWGKAERKQRCHPSHTHGTLERHLFALYPYPLINLVRPLSPTYPALASPSPAPSCPSRVQVKPQSKPSLLPPARRVSHHRYAQTV
jgi:hypothetical protein